MAVHLKHIELVRAMHRAGVQIMAGTDFSEEDFFKCMAINRRDWTAELLDVEELFMKLYNRLPKEMEMIRSLTTSALWRSPKQWVMNADPT